MASDILPTLCKFASGEMQPAEFRDRFFADDGFEPFLANDPNLDPANYVNGSVYHFLLDCDFDDPGGILNAHGAVCDYLDRNGYQYTKTGEYADFYDLVLKASPDWLDPDHKYVMDHIMPEADGRKGHELREWLHEQLLERYRYVSAPPDWIQSPCWPHGKAGPFVFLGQLDVNGYFHDAATVYVFHDPDTGKCESIVQCF
jgi:hypothetical protein